MSLTHLRLVRVSDDGLSASYRVESPDLSISNEWVDLGTIKLDKRSRHYDFLPSALWIEKKGIPPNIYALDKAEQKVLLASKYASHGWGAWAMIVHHYAISFLDKGIYPDKYPAVFFRK